MASTFTAWELMVNPLRVYGLIWLTYAVSARRLALEFSRAEPAHCSLLVNDIGMYVFFFPPDLTHINKP
ncbi:MULTISPECIES: hypothetical protein [Alcanivorax]|uniref:hypothetical protein n=1 Tax=Alcanivorax TaxID=59753 RepID=UPI002353040F|nr:MULTISPECIES: hypothetical protein [Alcanivorax]MDF1638543.1 hypothetical protein [Alcanivorax jadensis]